MTDRTHPDSGRIITSGDLLLHDAKTALMYEELRAAIDDGHESMTHADALAEIAAIRAENARLCAQLEAIGAGGVSGQLMNTLMNLLDEYAEVRHINGCWVYNSKTASARQAVIEALSGVQALSAAPNGWESVIDEARSGLQDSEPSAFDNSGYRAFAETVLAAVEEGLSALAASPTPQALSAEPAIKPLEWSSENEPTDKIRHNHITAETALGQFSVEWIGQKEEDVQCVYLAGDYIGVASNLDGAKQLAERHIRELVANLLAASPPAEQQAAPKAEPVKACVCGEPQASDTVHRVDGPCYVAAPQQEAQETTEVPYQKLTNEIDLILSDPDTELSIGAKRALLWMRTWVSVPLFTAPQQEAQEPVAWESTILGYIKYITQAQYEKFRPNVRRWYKPYKCSNCSAPQPAPAPLSDAIKHYLEAQDALDNREYAGINAESYEKLIRCRNASRKDLDAALAAQGGKA